MATPATSSYYARIAGRHHKTLRRLGLALLLLIALLLLGEGICTFLLRNRSNHYLVADVVRGRAVWHENPYFMCRFFNKRAAEIPPPLVAPQDPATAPFRVCILGDSAAAGWPDAAYSVARHLEMMLEQTSRRHIEVLNLSLREGNSHVLREVVRDLPRLHPNVTVILIGNNEVAGPCGPAAGFGRFHNSSRLARAEVLLSRSRLLQVVRLLHDRLHPARADEEAWRGREPISLGGRMAPNNPKLHWMHRAFQKNMAAIIRKAKASSDHVFLCTVPVNLRDAPPFATTRGNDEIIAQQVRETLRAAATATNASHAAALYDDALRLNPLHADALWQSARLQEKLGNPQEARRRFLAARDMDAIRLRVDSTMNQTLHELATTEKIPLIDLEAIFFADARPQAPGRTLFFDHIHFTFHGACLVANAIMQQLLAHPPPASPLTPPVPQETLVSGLLLYELWGHLDSIRQVQSTLQTPLFRRLANHADMMDHWANQRAAVEARLNAIPISAVTRIYDKRHADAPDDAWLAARAAAYFIERGQTARAAQAARAAMVVWPFRVDVRGLLSLALAMEGEPATTGIARITGGQEPLVYSDVSTAIFVGNFLRRRKHLALAEDWLAYAIKRDPCNSEAWILYADALRLQEHFEAADVALAQAAARLPDNPILLEERGVLACYWNQWENATRFFRQAEELAPDRALIFYKWANVMFNLRDYNRADAIIKRFRTMEPDDPDGIDLENRILAKLPPSSTPDQCSEKKNVRKIWE